MNVELEVTVRRNEVTSHLIYETSYFVRVEQRVADELLIGIESPRVAAWMEAEIRSHLKEYVKRQLIRDTLSLLDKPVHVTPDIDGIVIVINPRVYNQLICGEVDIYHFLKILISIP